MNIDVGLENIKKAMAYYDFIKEVYEDYIEYITNYIEKTSEYVNQLNIFKEKFNHKLNGKDKNKTKYKNINTQQIYSIVSPITKLINKQIESLESLMSGIMNQIKTYNINSKDSSRLYLNFKTMFEDASNDLQQKIQEILKAKENFMSSMANTEMAIKKYIDKEDNPILYNEMKNAVILSQKYEKEYKNIIKTVKTYEEHFDSSYEITNTNMKELINNTLKDIKENIFGFSVLFKNYITMQSVEIDMYFPELKSANKNKITEKDELFQMIYKREYRPEPYKTEKYKLKILKEDEKHEEDMSYSNQILKLEDGLDEMTLIKDEKILSILKNMKKYFNLIEINNMDLHIEEEKIKCLNLTDELLTLEDPKPGKFPKEDLDKLTALLDKHHNRVVFLQRLSEYRSKGKFEITKETFDILANLFNRIIDTVGRDNDFHSAKNTIIISQTYYLKTENNEKKYLQKMIQDNQIFKSKKFWDEFLTFAINKEIITCFSNDSKNGTILKENTKDFNEKKTNIAFTQILPYADNMVGFGLDKQMIQEVIFPQLDKYNMSNELIESVKAVLNDKK